MTITRLEGSKRTEMLGMSRSHGEIYEVEVFFSLPQVEKIRERAGQRCEKKRI